MHESMVISPTVAGQVTICSLVSGANEVFGEVDLGAYRIWPFASKILSRRALLPCDMGVIHLLHLSAATDRVSDQ